MILTLLATLGGGLFRLLPEFLKYFEKRDDRKHELAMFEKQLEADRVKGEFASEQARTQLSIEDVKAMVAATQAQATITGIKIVDAISALMRPLLTFWWCICLYTAALVAQYLYLLSQTGSQVGTILMLWGDQEKAIVASMIGFWFVDRTLRKNK